MRTYTIWVKRAPGRVWEKMAAGVGVEDAKALEDRYKVMFYLAVAEED